MATTNQNIAYYYAYDAAGRLTGVTDSNLRNIEYLYDAAGNRISMTIQDGTQGASAPRAISYE